MYFYTSPGGGELTSKEKDVYSLSSCRTKWHWVLCLSFKDHRTLTIPKETGKLRLLPTTSKASQIISKLFLPSAAAMPHPLDRQRCRGKGNRYPDLQTDEKKIDVSPGCAMDKSQTSRQFIRANARYDIYTIHYFSSSPFR